MYESVIKPPKEFEMDLRGGGDNFRSQIFKLIAKADPENLERLRLGFPLEVIIWEDWTRSICDIYPGEIDVQVHTAIREVFHLA